MRFSLADLIVAVFTASALTATPALAQTTSGQIGGHVVDPDGQPIANAEVTLTNQLTKDQRVQQTESSGEFVFVSVQPGTFSISVTASGFRTITKQDLMLTASERLSAGTLKMEIGPAVEQITVRAEVTPLQTDSGERSALLDEKQLATLLNPARNFMNLTRVLPGVVATNKVGQDQLGIYGIDSANGVRSEYNTATVDGVIGNTRGRDQIETPLWDMALFKNIPIKDRVTFQLRAELYNIFNHVSFTSVDNIAQFKYDANGIPGKQLSDTFGQLNAEVGPRTIQLAGRITV